jgi:hypothetical protein
MPMSPLPNCAMASFDPDMSVVVDMSSLLALEPLSSSSPQATSSVEIAAVPPAAATKRLREIGSRVRRVRALSFSAGVVVSLIAVSWVRGAPATRPGGRSDQYWL